VTILDWLTLIDFELKLILIRLMTLINLNSLKNFELFIYHFLEFNIIIIIPFVPKIVVQK